MKLIFSRKGLDSSAGGAASPILPSGRLGSLPIPGKGGNTRYGDIAIGRTTAGTLVEALTMDSLTALDVAHLDPDLDATALPRDPGWRPLFGQAGAAQGHLRNQAVGAGDIFLFYGWFRRVECVNGGYRYVADAPDMHVLYGWLQVDRSITVGEEPALPWARYHPHFQHTDRPNNTVYIARDQLDLSTSHASISGAGVFPQYHPSLRLTAPGEPRSVWRLPACFYPCADRTPLTYHSRPERWHTDGEHCLLHTAPRGQEFVLDCDEYPDVVEWAAGLLREAT